MKQPAAIAVSTLLVLLLLLPATAEWSGEEEIYDGLYYLSLREETLDRVDLGAPEGTVFDVWSAPFEDAFRGAEGRARLSADEPFTLLGTAEEGKWSMVEYAVSGTAKRIGWAQLPPVSAVWEGWDNFPAEDARPCTLTRDEKLTDDPHGERRTVLTLSAGDSVKALGLMDDAWAYVQTEVDGQTAWLFIPRDALEPERLWSVDENGLLTFREGVTRIGGTHLGWEAVDGEDEEKRIMAPLSRDEIAVPGLVYGESIPRSVRAVEFPASLRVLGTEALVYGQYDFIRLQSDPLCPWYGPFYALDTGRMILSAECHSAGAVLSGDHVTVGAWEVEEGNPWLKAVDGVLFSADGKRLIAYPTGSAAEHYTVPAGVEEICDRAFYDDSMSIPLKTISLPIGLKRIGEYAFDGCGRLLSLAVPLTVTDLAETAFSSCVSLERLSLPPGLKASFNDDWGVQSDPGYYFGDNGALGADTEDTGRRIEAWLDTPDGLGTVPWYASPDAKKPAGDAPAGTAVSGFGVSNGRMETWFWDRDAGDGTTRWYDLGDLRVMPGKVFFTWADEDETVRTRTGDERTLGVLTAPSPLAPIPILDGPGGAEVTHTFEGEQAEVLEKEGAWLRIRTAGGTLWVAKEYFTEIPQAEN